MEEKDIEMQNERLRAALKDVGVTNLFLTQGRSGDREGYPHHHCHKYRIIGVKYNNAAAADISQICATVRDAGFSILSCGFEIPLQPEHCARRVITQIPLPSQFQDVAAFVDALCKTNLQGNMSDIDANVDYGDKDDKNPLATLSWRTKATSSELINKPKWMQNETEQTALRHQEEEYCRTLLWEILKSQSINANIPPLYAPSLSPNKGTLTISKLPAGEEIFEPLSDIEYGEEDNDEY